MPHLFDLRFADDSSVCKRLGKFDGPVGHVGRDIEGVTLRLDCVQTQLFEPGESKSPASKLIRPKECLSKILSPD